MAMINSLICEYKLPLPSLVTEDSCGDFKDVVWDEYVFYTSSFFDIEDMNFPSIYTITEDGQFYKETIETEIKTDKNGKSYTKEKSKGIEKQEFTGLIYFGSEILGKDNDYSIDFKALFYKGDLKELGLEECKEHDNKKRKAAMAEISEHFKKEANRQNSLAYLILLPFRRVAFFVISMIKWVMFKVFHLLLKIESWIRS